MNNFIANFLIVSTIVTTAFAALNSDVRSTNMQQRFGPKLSAGKYQWETTST